MIKFVALDRFEGDKESFSEFRARIKKVSEEEAKRLAGEIERCLNRNTNITEEIKELVLAGARLDHLAFGKYKDNLLIYSVRKNNQDLFRVLARAGMPVDSTNEYGTTPLMVAARHARLDILDDCIFLGANPNRQCSDGDTAAHSAARHNGIGALKRLQQVGASFSIPNQQGELPEDVAQDSQTKEYFKNLKSQPIKPQNVTIETLREEVTTAKNTIAEIAGRGGK